MVKMAVDTFGKIDFLYNNAGYQGSPTPMVEVNEEFWNIVQGIDL